ncbi:winged helix-turn-helix transcriptional regulator [Clostridium sp. 'deep sea']|uniref:MarR family winged helix-turn-helix transcriptional regulator n=1 Tax=Clostridium sp. 'deep sea' TaxID=2779445 RepID=UPI0018967CA4|nr:MarR family winged helix-turn-helix transcriptional regulator [Clostridium sp. 'deep sea']QOR36391.1 winged helix-turn-helix transcriptional regulator [Clostridium sp. 'deep sea']
MKDYKELLDLILYKFLNKTIENLYFNITIPISISMLYYMDKIYLFKKITPSQLADEVKVSRPASTKMVKKLLKLGYIEKNTSEIKGNTYTVSLTKEGHEIYKISNKINEEFIDLLYKHLELDKINDLTLKLNGLLDEYNSL